MRHGLGGIGAGRAAGSALALFARRAAGSALALFAGCTAVAPGGVSHPRETAFHAQPCQSASRPDNPDLLPECVPEASADQEPNCLPLQGRGREIARDDEAHLRAYEVCVPESRYAPHPRLRVDPGRVIVERSGERLASFDDLETIASFLSDNRPMRAPDLPDGKPAPREGLEMSNRPETFICVMRGPEGLGCLQLHLLGPRPEPARLLAGIAKWLPSDGSCIAMQVDSGWREGCPEVNVLRAQEQASR